MNGLKHKRSSKRSTTRQIVLATGAACAALWGSALEARAGEWVKEADAEGMKEVNPGGSGGSGGSWEETDAWEEGLDWQQSADPEAVGSRAEGDPVPSGFGFRNKGSAAVTFRWVPEGSIEDDPAPDKLFVLEYGGANAFSTTSAAPAISEFQLDNGLGGETQVWTPWATAPGSGRRQETRKLSQYDGSSGTVTLPRRSFESTIVSSDLAWVGSEIYYGASADTRAVSITSPTVEDSYHKEPAQGGLELNQRQPDGSIQGDSVMNWDDVKGWTAGGTFNAVTPGFTSPSYQWNVSGGEPLTIFDQEAMSSTQVGTQFTLQFGGERARTYGDSTTVKVDVTDSDGVVGANTFWVYWHLPFENWADYAPSKQGWHNPPLDIAAPGYAENNAGITARYNMETVLWADVTADLATSVFAFAGAAATNPIWTGLWAACGIAAADITTQATEQTPQFDSCWTDSRSTFDVPPANGLDSTQDLYRMTPVRNVGYTTRFLRGDAYGPNGFTGPARKAVQFHDGRVGWSGDFFLANPPSGGGGGTE